MKQYDVEFPCTDGFLSVPTVMPSIVGGKTTKMYSASISKSSEKGFSVNVQRVDDVDQPDMTCSELRLCYIAIA